MSSVRSHTNQSSTSILLVEDSHEDFLTIKRAFKKSGFNNSLSRLETGDECIELLKNLKKNNKLHELPAVILLDLNLPGTDGKEVLKALKEDEVLRVIPIIILTTSADEMDVESCYKIGANSYITKPVDTNGFINALSLLSDYWFNISVTPKF